MERSRLARECAKLDPDLEKAMAITGQPQHAGFPLTLELKSGILPKTSWAKISQIRTLSVERIGKRIGRTPPEELTQVIEGVNEIIGT